jgi:hypothetical protein
LRKFRNKRVCYEDDAFIKATLFYFKEEERCFQKESRRGEKHLRSRASGISEMNNKNGQGSPRDPFPPSETPPRLRMVSHKWAGGGFPTLIVMQPHSFTTVIR